MELLTQPHETVAAERPLVSIIIPCFNGKAFVADAIRSALDQSYQPVEVIVIDDGSTDGSLEVIRSFGEAIRWYSGPNRGGSAARNHGVSLARGEIIQFLDADDVLFADKLQRMVPVLLAAGPDAMAFCDWEQAAMDATSPPVVRHLDYACADPVVFCLRAQLQTSSPLHWKRNLEAVGGFDETLPCSQDRELHLRLACNELRFVHLPRVCYRVRRRARSVSDDFVRVLRHHPALLWSAYERLRETRRLTEPRKRAFAALMARDARCLIQRGYEEEAIDYVRQARAMHPDGGIRDAYGRAGWVFLHRLLGPVRTERLIERSRAAQRTLGWLRGRRARLAAEAG